MRILLLLAMKCLTYLKVGADQMHELQLRDVFSGQISQLDECSKSYLQMKHYSSSCDLLAIDLGDLEQSPRRKREVERRLNKNKVLFRRRKKKLYRQSRIRKSLFKRGKFTTATPYSHMKKYIPGKGKLVKPPGLKYRKRYRFNHFKKTQDVALGIGAGGRANVQHNQPKKRPPIHVRDYERRQQNRLAFRGHFNDRKLPGDRDRRLRKGANADHKRSRAPAKKSQKDYYDSGSFRTPAKKSGKDYYDELGSYDSKLDIDSLAKQTKSRKSYGRTAKIPQGSATKRRKAAKSDYSDEDNTLLLSAEEQLTDVSSDISDLRSEVSDERPKHRKNVSSSEYKQYSYAEDDSAIVDGEVVSSKDESLKSLQSSRKTTLLGPIDYKQYDIKKLEASVERAFKKKSEKGKGLDYSDPFEDIEDGYNDETSYESGSDSKQAKQKSKKSKISKHEKQQKTTKKRREPKVKIEKTQSPELKSHKSADSEDYYNSLKYTDEDYCTENENSTASEDYYSENHTSDEEYGSESKSSTADEDYYSSEDKYSEKNSTSDDDYYSSDDEETYSEKNSTTDKDYYGSEDKHSENSTANEDYYSDDDYSNYKEPITPIRRIPTKKVAQHSTKENFYEEYTDSEDQKKPSKSKKYPKLSVKNDHPSRKEDQTASYQVSEHDTDYSYSLSKNEKRKISINTDLTSKKITKKSLKSTSKKSIIEISDYESLEYSNLKTSAEYNSDASKSERTSPKSRKTTKKTISAGKTTSTKKLKSTKGHDTSVSDYESYESYSYKSSDKKTPKQSTTVSKKDQKQVLRKRSSSVKQKVKKTTSARKTTSTKKLKSEKGHDISVSDYESYESYSYESSDKKTSEQPTTVIKKDQKQAPTKKTLSVSDSESYESYSYENYDEKTPQQPTTRSKKDPKQSPTKKTKKTTSAEKITFTTDLDSEKAHDTSNCESEDYKSDHSVENNGKKKSKVAVTYRIASTKMSSARQKLRTEKNKKIHETSDYTSSSEYSDEPLPFKKTVPKKSFKNFTTPKKLPKITLKKNSKIKKKSSEPHQNSDYHSEETSFNEESFEKAGNLKENLSKSQLENLSTKTTGLSTQNHDLEEQTTETDEISASPSLKVIHRKSTTTLKRTKKGFTTLPMTKKMFNSEETLRKISSKAADITQKHIFLYNTKRKAYELVSVQYNPYLPSTNILA